MNAHAVRKQMPVAKKENKNKRLAAVYSAGPPKAVKCVSCTSFPNQRQENAIALPASSFLHRTNCRTSPTPTLRPGTADGVLEFRQRGIPD